jgi:hypothetical protein
MRTQHATKTASPKKKSAAQLDREIQEALAPKPKTVAPSYDELVESPALKADWLRKAKRRFPEGSVVHIVKSDKPAYENLYGTVVGYDIGDFGAWPLVSVQLERPTDGSTIDGFYGDGDSGDEIVRVSPKELAATLDADENVALDLIMQGRNGAATATLRKLVPDDERRNYIKRVGAYMKTLRSR